MDRILLRPSEAAELLGLSRSKVYALLASGELPSVKIGVATRLPVAELREWLVAKQRGVEDAGLDEEATHE